MKEIQMLFMFIELLTASGITIAQVVSGPNQVKIYFSNGLIIGEVLWEVVIRIEPFLVTVGLSHIRPE